MNIKMMSEEDYIDKYGSKPKWTGVDYDDSVYLFFKENELVADAVLFIENNRIIIDNIEVMDKYQFKGIGTEIVKILKSNYGRISGESVVEAMGFWSKMGAIFNNEDLSKLDKDIKYPYLIRFNIN